MNRTELMIRILLQKGLTVEQVSEELSLDIDIVQKIATRYIFSLNPSWFKKFEKEAGYAPKTR